MWHCNVTAGCILGCKVAVLCDSLGMSLILVVFTITFWGNPRPSCDMVMSLPVNRARRSPPHQVPQVLALLGWQLCVPIHKGVQRCLWNVLACTVYERNIHSRMSPTVKFIRAFSTWDRLACFPYCCSSCNGWYSTAATDLLCGIPYFPAISLTLSSGSDHSSCTTRFYRIFNLATESCYNDVMVCVSGSLNSQLSLWRYSFLFLFTKLSHILNALSLWT